MAHAFLELLHELDNFSQTAYGISEIFRSVAVFIEACRLIGLGWIYAYSNLLLIVSLIDQVYKYMGAITSTSS